MYHAIGNFTFNLPQPQPLSLDGDIFQNINVFREQWNSYCLASGLDKMTENTKAAFLNLCIGQDALHIISQNLNIITKDDRENCERLLSALENFFKIRNKHNTIYERYVFHTIIQFPNETIKAFVDRLRTQAHKCFFLDSFNDRIRDQLIFGLRHEHLRSCFFQQLNLDLHNIINICQEYETHHSSAIATEKPVFESNNVIDMDRLQNIDRISDASTESSNKEFCIKGEEIVITDSIHNQSSINECNVIQTPLSKKINFERLIESGNQSILDETRTPSSTSNNILKRRDAHVSIVTPSIIQGSNSSYCVGDFVIPETDLKKFMNKPIWRVDSMSLLQKFDPVHEGDSFFYRSTPTYSGTSTVSKSSLIKICVSTKVRRSESGPKEILAYLQKANS